MITPKIIESEWESVLGGLPLWQPPRIPTVVIAPHPDDETLGVGGLIAALRRSGLPVTIIAVTDGENAYSGATGLGKTRQREQTEALEKLGVGQDKIIRLRMTDSGITENEQSLANCLMTYVSPGMHVLAPWERDFHPDHEACGRAAATVAQRKGISLTSYLFWAWHRGDAQILDGFTPVRFLLTPSDLCAKRDALACHRSQLEHESGFPILPSNLLDPAKREFEVFLPS